jgi:hypothetical protein
MFTLQEVLVLTSACVVELEYIARAAADREALDSTSPMRSQMSRVVGVAGRPVSGTKTESVAR